VAKAKKAPVATAADPFFDLTGHPLAVNDSVLIGEDGQSMYNGHSGIITALHREGSAAVATVAFAGDSTVPKGSQGFFLKTLTYVASHPAIQDEPDLPWLDCDGNVLHEGDKATVLPDVSKRLSGKLVTVLGEYDPQKKSVQVAPEGWEGPDFGILLCFLKRLPVLGENVGAEPITSADIEEAANTPTATTAPVYTPTKMKLVPLADIIVTSNTRKIFDEAELQGLADSIKAQGVIAPITVRPHGTEAGKFELVAGERRLRASKLAEQQTIPAVIRTLTDREFLEIQLLENLQRVDVRPADEAQAFSKLLKNDFSAEEVALKVGKPVKFVLQRAKLATLIPFWFEALEQGRLLLVSANELARLPAHSQLVVKHAFEKSNYPGAYPTREISGAIESKVTRNLEKAPWDKADAYLVPSAGPCTTCPKRSGAQVLLFEAQEGPDLCLDGGCFASKVAAFVGRRADELKRELGKAPMQASSNYYLGDNQKDAGIIPSRDWYQSHEGASGAVPVLMIDGVDAGQIKYVRLSGMAAMKEGRANATDAEKAADAARLRGQRQEKMLRTIIGEKLTLDVQADPLGKEGLAVLRWLITEQLRGQSKSKLAFVVDECGWDVPTEAQMDNWKVKEANGKTPYANWLSHQLETEADVLDTLGIYLALEARHKMDNEYETRQLSMAALVGETYDPLKQQAAEFVEARYYTRKGKKQEATA
jgi:ParB/RepB/Spo0J family partition protein